MFNPTILFCIIFWPLFAAVSVSLVPRLQRRTFGIAFSAIGLVISIIGGLYTLTAPLEARIVFCLSAALPVIAHFYKLPNQHVALIFLVAGLSAWVSLTSDMTQIAFGCTIFTAVRVIMALKAASRVGPIYAWGRLAIFASILCIAGSALLTATPDANHNSFLVGELFSSLGLVILLAASCGPSSAQHRDPLTATLTAGLILSAVTGLHHVGSDVTEQNIIIIFAMISSAVIVYHGRPSAALIGCLAALASALPGREGVWLVLAFTACLSSFLNEPFDKDIWLLSFIPPSPLMPATLTLIWMLSQHSIYLACALITIVIGQLALRPPQFPSKVAWRSSPALWLLLALGLFGPLFLFNPLETKGINLWQ